MGERLRGRDARNNSNKCYAAFFEEGDDDPHHSSAKTAKMKISRSPPKKRESPKKRSKRAALTTVQNSLELGVAVHVPVDGGSDVLTKQPVETSSAFVANVTTKTITPSYSPKECDQRTTKMGEGQCVEVCVAGKKEVDEGVEAEVRELNGEENKTEHVVVSDDDEENMKSESLKSNNNNKRKFSASSELNSLQLVEHLVEANGGDEDIKKLKLNSVKDQMFEIFQPWALKTYGDQAKTKTITRRKKNRILKALDGKEQNNPDSSKFRFWVKSKGFTVQRPQNFFGYSSPGEVTSEKGAAIYKLATAVGMLQGQASTVQEMDTQKDHIDLYVASTVKDFGERVYRKVAVVEEFFEIIYNVHVERGGRNGRHAGQKRTYRIITETYAFLPREAVTKFLTSCPTCKKNLRPFSPSRFDDTFTESSSEYEALNYSSQNESSVDSLQLGPIRSVRRKAEGKASPLVTNSYSECVDMATPETKCDRKRYNEAVFNFDKNSSKIEEPTKFDDKFKLGQDFLSSEKFSFLERPRVGEGYPFSERFNMNNLLRPEFLHKGMIGLHGLFMSNERPNIDSRFHANEKWNQMHYPLSPNYYQYFGKPPRTPCNSPVGHRERICDKIPAGTPNNENLDSSIDLTINQASSININIGSSPDAKSQSSGSTKKLKLDHADEVCFNTVDVSINMLNSSNELKISCKTTPPKKRYNAFRDKESNPLSTLSATYSNTTTGDSVIGDENCAMNLSKTFRSELSETKPAAMKMAPTGSTVTAEPFQVDLSKVKPITSTYLRMTRSFGLSDEDALRIDDLETLPTPGTDPTLPETNPEEAYAGLMKDADKLKLMLLAWNYQNSNAIRNGAEAPDLGVVGGLWAQYQNALALNAKQPSVSPINRTEQPSPIENQDETNSSGQKDEDDGSEDDSDDKLDQNAHDPERLKAFNMFVRLFVDENLDRMIPISKQPKEKIQAIIDSCARQFPEFCERSRKRIRTYLKSCRRNKKAREGWDNASRPTPAHLTSVQAEQILAMACENESLNAKRMRIGLDPISQSLPLTSNSTVTTDVVAPSITYPGFRATPSTTAVSTSELDAAQPSTTTQTVSSARSSPISLTTNLPAPADSKPNTPAVNGTVTSQIASPLYRPTEFTSPTSTSSPYTSSTRPTAAYPVFFPASNNVNATPTDLSMKQHTPTTTQPCNQQLPTLPVNTGAPVPASGRPPLLSHKLNPNEMSAVRQLITGYRESAAFLLRSADELEQLLLQQQ